jgi:hypothetical protein
MSGTETSLFEADGDGFSQCNYMLDECAFVFRALAGLDLLGRRTGERSWHFVAIHGDRVSGACMNLLQRRYCSIYIAAFGIVNLQ